MGETHCRGCVAARMFLTVSVVRRFRRTLEKDCVVFTVLYSRHGAGNATGQRIGDLLNDIASLSSVDNEIQVVEIARLDTIRETG